MLNKIWLLRFVGPWFLDGLDLKIFRLLMMGAGSFLGNDARHPYRVIGTKLHLTEDTVRKRIDKFNQEGFIRGWKLGVNPTLFRQQSAYLFFDIGSSVSKTDAISKIKLIDGVLFILSYYGKFLGVHLTHKDEEELGKKKELIKRICGSNELVSMKISFPDCVIRISETDWRVIKSLRNNPRKSFTLVAKEAGISSRTAKRRTGRMVQGGAIYTLPDIDTGALRGAVASSLSIFYSDPKLAQQVANVVIHQFDDYLIMFHIADREHGWFAFLLPNIAKVAETERYVSDLEGVRNISMRLVEGFVNLVDQTFEREISERSLARVAEATAK